MSLDRRYYRWKLFNQAAGILIVLFGFLLIFNVNLFKHLGFLSQFAQKSRGKSGGFILGLTLGIIRIPCVGPMFSSVLALVVSLGHSKIERLFP